MATTVRVWHFLGLFIPVVIYHVYGVGFYIKTIWISNPDYVRMPKYKRFVWKIHRLQVALNPYYKHLSKEGKVKFISRLIHLFPKKQFVGREGENITLEKKIIILSALVQLTFGLKKYVLPRFEVIAIYPSDFYSRLLDVQVKGLTFSRGHILLSWFDTLKGFYKPKDNLNLAIHEWSHALVIDHSHDTSKRMYATLNTRSDDLQSYYHDIKSNKDMYPYLREYGFTNEHEFFAVCAEHFFETPEEFIREMPDVYVIFTALLNQNPLNRSNDYKLES
ncbi:zinc-dependent peptidase [Bacteroidia bacterium]|nr:zinc-dependent peptidase [Bacteroidia bacterium]